MSRDNWHQTGFGVIPKKIMLSVILIREFWKSVVSSELKGVSVLLEAISQELNLQFFWGTVEVLDH